MCTPSLAGAIGYPGMVGFRRARPRRTAAWLLLAGFVGTGGCASSGHNEGPTASPVQHPTLENIPVPSGFQLVDTRTVGSASGKVRMGVYEFEGNGERAIVNRFYKEYMPSAGWTLKRERIVRGVYDMWFESPSELCNIQIRPEGRRTAILVDLAPLPEGPVEREKRPAMRRPD